MPRLSYPADWGNLAIYFARARQTSNLSAADIIKRLEDDGSAQRFELQSLVPLGGPAGHTRVSKFEVCDCGRFWIRTPLGWHQASDFEIRDHPPPLRKKLRFELILPLADGDEEAKPAADDKPTVRQRRAAEAAARKAKKDEAKALDAERESRAADFILDHAGTWLKPGMDLRCQGMCEKDFEVGFRGYRRVKNIVKTWLEQLAETSAKQR
jgi:hypothetical protein